MVLDPSPLRRARRHAPRARPASRVPMRRSARGVHRRTGTRLCHRRAMRRPTVADATEQAGERRPARLLPNRLLVRLEGAVASAAHGSTKIGGPARGGPGQRLAGSHLSWCGRRRFYTHATDSCARAFRRPTLLG